MPRRRFATSAIPKLLFAALVVFFSIALSQSTVLAKHWRNGDDGGTHDSTRGDNDERHDKASLTSVKPNVGEQGTHGLSVELTGQLTHFKQGETKVDFGHGIRVIKAEVHSPTDVTAVLYIDDDAPLGAHDVSMSTCGDHEDSSEHSKTDDGNKKEERVTLDGGFTVVKKATPVLLAVAPNRGAQGQQNLAVIITGEHTHFEQGQTSATFGPSVNVVSIKVISSTVISTVLNVDSGATTGPRDVTVTTQVECKRDSNDESERKEKSGRKEEKETLKQGFTIDGVQNAALIKLSPNAGQQGQPSLSVTITGQNTHFVQGKTTASFGSGITVASLTVSSPTSATASISIDPSAAIGGRNVALSTDTEVASLANGFSVTAGPAVLTILSPNTGQQGQQGLSISIAGQFTHFSQNATSASFGLGITVVSLAVNSATSATAMVNIDPAATTGSRNVTLTTSAETVTLSNSFTVNPGIPILTALTPNIGQQGQQNLSVTITGRYTHFSGSVTTANFGAGITVVSLTVNSATSLAAVLNIDAFATIGTRSVTLTTGSEGVSFVNSFSVTAGTPILQSLAPNTGQQGQQSISVTINGQYTHFSKSATTASFGAGITVVSLAVNSATSVTVVVSIDPSASIGTRNVTLTTNAETATLVSCFTVTAATPVLVSLNPSSGQQGQKSLLVTMTGQYTHFQQGVTTASFGTGITASSVTVNSSTNSTVLLDVDPAAAVGSRSVTLMTNSEAVMLANAFTITAAPPALISLSPSSGQQGSQNLSVVITGQYTHFVSGVTTASFGSGVTVSSVSVNSATSLSAVVNIDPSTGVGPRTVALNTNSEAVSSASLFAVTAGTQALTQIKPNSAQQGQQGLSVALTGLYTHFVQGVTTANFGSGISVASVTVNSSTNATAVINVDPAAVVGGHSVTLTTNGEAVTLSNGFRVTATSAILLSLSPSTGQQGQLDLSLLISGQNTHFAQGTTTASLGAGIKVASLTVTSQTDATAVINIDSTAAIGRRALTLTTGSEVVSLSSAFSVTPGTPVLQRLSPNNGQQGQKDLSVMIAGEYTQFAQGSTVANFGAGVSVGSITVNSATSLTALISIDQTASIGLRPVSVTTGSQAVSLIAGFEVSPASNVAPIVNAGPDRTVAQSWELLVSSNNCCINSPVDEAVLRFDGSSGSYLGVVTPITGASGISYPDRLFVDEVGRLYVSVRANQNEQLGGIYRYDLKTGAFIDAFLPLGAAGPGDAPEFTVGVDGNFYVANDQTQNIQRFNGETGSFIDIFATAPVSGAGGVDAPAFGPNNHLYATQGGTNNATIVDFDSRTGGFLSTFAVCPTSGPFTPASLLFGPDGNLYVSGLDARDVIRFNGKTGAFIDTFIAPGSGGMTRATDLKFGPDGNLYVTDLPAGENAGQVLRYDGVTGQFMDAFIPVGSGGLLRAAYILFHMDGSAAVLSGAVTLDGSPAPSTVTVAWSKLSGPGAVTFANASLASTTATFSATGTYVLQLSASNGQLTSTSQTTVTVVSARDTRPSITSVSPTSGVQGQAGPIVRLIGQNTSWIQGTTVASFGNGISISSLIVNSPTSATVSLAIGSSATVGPRTVTMTTGNEVESLEAGFYVTVAKPTISQITPETGVQGQQNLLVAITGQGTHFAQGISTVSFGTGVIVNSVVVSDSVDLSVSISIAATAPTGPHTVTVKTGTEVASLADAFAVLAHGLSASAGLDQFIGFPVVSIGEAQFPSDQLLYAVTTDEQLLGIDSRTGVVAPIGSLQLPEPSIFYVGLDFNIDGTLYLGDGGGGVYDGSLYSINLATGKATLITKLSTMYGSILQCMAFAKVPMPGPNESTFPAGTLFGSEVSQVEGTDISTGTEQPIGNLGYDDDAFATSPAGVLFGSTADTGGTPGVLYTINTQNAATTVISKNIPDADTLTYGPADHLYVSGNSSVGPDLSFLSSIDPQTGATQPIGSTGHEIVGLSFHSPIAVTALNGSFTDSLSGVAVATTWSLLSGPAPVTFDSPSSPTTFARFTTAGTYVLQFSASDTISSASANVNVVVSNATLGTLSVIAPSSAQPGQSVSVLITGQGFVPGQSYADFGPGTTVGNGTPGGLGIVNVINPTEAVATIQIDSSTWNGPRNVVVQTGTQAAWLPNGFAIGNSEPLSSVYITPNSGLVGQTIPVTITGNNTHFIQGTTLVSLGSSVSVSGINVNSDTELTADVVIPTTASTGFYTLTVSTGQEVESLGNGFQVSAAAAVPSLSLVSPNSGPQGQSGPVGITGQNTHFLQGSTLLDFGPGITVSNITVGCSTCLTAILAIDSAASPGPRTVTATTGTEIVSLPNGFTVKSSGNTPILTSINPINGRQGQSLSVAITGASTHFVQGTTQVSFGPGITTTAISVNNSASLTAQIQVDPNAAPGTRTVTVSTGSEVESVTSVFNVTAGIPALYSLSPGSAQQGATGLSILVTSLFTHFVQGTSQISFGSGITVSNIAVLSPTSLRATINIAANAPTGTATVTVTTAGEVATLTNGFTVTPATPIIYTVDPGGGRQGQQNLSVVLTGQFTNWVQGTTSASFGPGVSVVSLTISSATIATAVVNIDPTSAIGARTVTLVTGSEIDSFAGGFQVVGGTPALLSASPSSGQTSQGSISVALKGQFTSWVQGTTTADFGAGITVTGLTINSATTATALINITSTALPGPHSITMNTGNEVEVLANGFTLGGGAPTLVSSVPSSGTQGQQNLAVTVTGQFTHFAQGSTQITFGSDISVGTVTITSATSLTALITISPSALPTAHTISVATGAEQVALANGFSVQSSNSPFTVSPDTGLQGKTFTVTITSQGAQFEAGVTSARFGPGVMVGTGIAGDFAPINVTSPTTATAQITVLTASDPGLRTVTVQVGTTQLSAQNAFEVVGLPAILYVSPAATLQNQTGSVTIVGAFTHFLQGTTQVSFGPGISIGGGASGGFGAVTVTSPTLATAQISIDQSASLGPRSVSLKTGTEQASLANGFSVLGPVIGPGPTVAITSPTEASEVTTATIVTGSVSSPNLDHWVLEYQATGATAFVQFATGTTPAVNGTLDPTLLLDGNTVVRLTGIDTSGQTSATLITVVVTRNQKVGNFTVSFNDLTVPVAGLPITIVRTYDSRNQQVGDFGVGWTLDLKNVVLSTNGALGANWAGAVSGGFVPQYCVQAALAHVVTISLTDGTTYEFQPVLSGQCQAAPPSQVSMSFTPIGVTPPNAGLTIAGNTLLYVNGDFNGSIQLYDSDDVTIFDPDQFVLTLPDGRTLQISTQSGLQSITDLNGNILTVTANGIMHSSGKGVTFTRDTMGRITAISDPSGNTLGYRYDDAGNLASFTDQLKQSTSYSYNSSHGLLTIVDPRGVQPIRNDYDETGRLVSHTDAYGNVINYSYDLGTNQETATDRLGNLTVNEYDADGNIVKVTDALGGVTIRTYDSSDNMLSETNALKETRTYTYDANKNRLTEADPLGNTTRYTYNVRNQVLTITDALKRVTTNVYDSNGNLLSTTDPAGGVTSYVYNSQGLRTSMTDALGETTTSEYDDSGNLTKQTDPLGNSTSYTYDANGNKLSETKTRTVGSAQHSMVTNFQYDSQNRLIQTTFPDASTTQIQYNAIGKQSVTTDQLGHQTSYQYDLMGRVTQTAYPDSTSESSTYDAEGDRATSTDRAGRVTTYLYDPIKRLTKTTYPDKSSTSTAYDLGGEVLSVTDALGHTTQFQYDADGRRTKSTDALAHVTSFAYDMVGNQTSITDANGNATQYQYDPLNRRTVVKYPDGTTDTTGYDALGRTTSKTDQAGKSSQFSCDKDGRLVQVTDALGQITKYTYDEVGDRITQTNANKHTTSFGYDDLGRRTQRTLPLGMSESESYDAAGNLNAKVDFNGKTTTYTYDDVNRLLSKVPDPSFSAPTVKFTYTSTGQRASMVDASGTTTYVYDLRDRLTKKATPEGTIAYTYDDAGNLTSMHSSNTGGTSISYTYDPLNRLASAIDNHPGSGTTTYSYDNAGNLAGYVYPNGVATTYQYNSLNRLTNLTLAKGSTLATYAYTLGLAGNRTAVAEFGGRQVNYTYDDLYRLTGEMITGNSDTTLNGSIAYQYDPVGNRLNRASALTAVPPASYSYDDDDRLTTDSYDANGSTINSGGKNYGYDFENHLISSGGGTPVSITYDGDGNRVSETADGTVTQYLVDDRNLTGYTQVLEELAGNTVQRVYSYGLNRISQSQVNGMSFYGYDGHGNVRSLMNITGETTDQYGYDAFGNILNRTGSTSNVYWYSGEQSDPSIGWYYLRARYYASSSGRFATADTFDGMLEDPSSLHKYNYARSNPENQLDPTGHQYDLPSLVVAISVDITLETIHASYLNALLGVSIDSLACIRCLINPGYQMQNDALQLVDDPIFAAGASASYLVGQQLVSKGYQDLGSNLSTFYLDVGLGSIKVAATAGILRTQAELRIFETLINSQMFQEYAEGLLPISPLRSTTVGDITDTWENIKEAYRLYNELHGVSDLVKAFTSSKPRSVEAGKICDSVLGVAASFIPSPIRD